MITLAPADVVIVAAYFAAVLLIGFLSRRRGADTVEFLLAGRSLTLPVFVMTLVSTWYGGILGVGEFSYRYGISNWFVQGVPYYVFALLFAVLLAKRVRATNLSTLPDRLEQAYGRAPALLGALLTFLLMTPAPYVLMIGLLLQLLTGWGLVLCVVLGTALTTVALGVGGFRADVRTDVFEFIMMFGGFAVILPFAVARFGGVDFLLENLPERHLVWHGGHAAQFIAVWFLIALWTLVDPAFHQRCYAAKSGKIAQQGILVSILFWFVFDAMTATAGLYARAALPSLQQPVLAYPLLAEATLPPAVKGLFYVGLLATIMSTLNTLSFVSATALGRDLVWRMRGGRPETERRWTQWGLAATALLSILLALIIPSVIKLWYTIGTVIVPGLLIPLVTSYFSRWRVGGAAAFLSMLLGWLTSLVWLLAGWTQELGSTAFYPLGVEPMIPGLAVSTTVWWIGLRRVRKEEVRSTKA